jgi:rod shape-determining protein MreB
VFKKSFYVQIRENRFHVRNLGYSRSFERTANPPFSHPRLLVGDFAAADVCLKSVIAEVSGSGFTLAIEVLIHPLEKLEGGITQIEERLFRELAIGAGASKVLVWVGPPLSDSEAMQKLNGK